MHRPSCYPRFRPSDISSDMEIPAIHSYIHLAETEIHRLEFEMALLLAKRAEIIACVHRYRLITAPYKRLPAELITEIIQLCIPADSFLHSKPGKWDPRLVLTQVCSAWRAVAFNTPGLWHITLPYPLHDRTFSLASTWIRQCSSSKLQLKMASPRAASGESKYLMPKILDLIRSHSHRFQSLALEIHPDYLNSLLTLPFNNLEEIVFRLGYFGLDEKEKIDISSHQALPSLQSVTIKNIRPGINCLSSQLPLSRLTELSLVGRIDAIHTLTTLAQCTSLQRCCLCNVYIADPLRTGTPLSLLENQVISLPHLQSLAFGVGSSNWTHLLYSFRVPNLLWLKAPINFTDPRCIPFFQHIPNLRHCIFRHDRRTPSIVLDTNFLSCIPNVITLVLPSTHTFDAPTLAKIGTGELLPKVEKLECGQQSLQLASSMMISRQVKAKENPGIISPIIDAVSFIMGDDIDTAVLEAAIKDMSLKGLSTKITRLDLHIQVVSK